jgi:hypothetical protein
MGGCRHHGWAYWAGGGTGRCRYSFCSLCRTQRAAEAVGPGETLESNKFLRDNAEALAPEKSVSVHTTSIAAEYKSGRDNAPSPRAVVKGAAEDEFLNRFDTMLDLFYETDRLQDAIEGILDGPVRAAASKYGLDKEMVFDVRLLIESQGREAAVEKLLKYVQKRQRRADLASQKLAA